MFQEIRRRISVRGTRGFIGFQRQLRIMDDDQDRAISYQEFRKAMRDYKIELSEGELEEIFSYLDHQQTGKISIDELIQAVQGEFGVFRNELVSNAFVKLDRDHDGRITVSIVFCAFSSFYSSSLLNYNAIKSTSNDSLNRFATLKRSKLPKTTLRLGLERRLRTRYWASSWRPSRPTTI